MNIINVMLGIGLFGFYVYSNKVNNRKLNTNKSKKISGLVIGAGAIIAWLIIYG